MTLSAVAAPLAAYAVIFQTLIYLTLPVGLRTRVAPVVTGLVGAGLSLGAALIFGFGEIGLLAGEPMTAVAWGVATVVLMTVLGLLMLSRDELSAQMADSRLASLGGADAFTTIFVRIPVFTALIEEAFFRGVLHAALTALYPIHVAVWLGAGLFGLWHIGPGLHQAQAGDMSAKTGAVQTGLTVVATTILGAFLVWLRIETGSIWAPVAVHAATNMTMAVFARIAGRRIPAVVG
ncbi:MAG TPA: CPBP family intramembrane glutamic endopeptidase [Acidimicrobiia bacterium]